MIKTSHVATLLLSAAVVFAQGTSSQTGQTGQGQAGSSTQSNPQTTGQSGTQSSDTSSSKSSSKTHTSRASDTSQAGGESMVGLADRNFVMKAAEGGMMEVQLAQLAQKQASSDQVKQYAQKLEQDHTNANKQLMEIAQRRNVNVPSTLKPENQQMIDKLTKMSGADFDKAYIKHMVKDHKKDVKEFEKYSQNGMDTDLKTFASSTVPKLREHLTEAEGLEKNVGGSGTRSRSKDADHSKMDHSGSGTGNSTGNTTGTTSGSSNSSQGTTGTGTGSSTTTPPPQR